MTDLSDFGGGIDFDDIGSDEPEVGFDANDSTAGGRTYRNGRCPAISTTTRRRCKSPVSRMNAAGEFCGVHSREHEPWTIHDDPETLVLLTGELDATSLADLEPDDVDFDLERVRQAVAAVEGGAPA